MADQLIATLKAELAAQKEASKEIQRLKKELEASESRADTLQHKLTELTTSLSESKSEIKSLNLKLTAARNAEAAATAATAKVPGSAIKGSTAASRLAAANASEAIQQATLAAQKKENLYGDLTGLIVRSVKRENGEDVFDCIQTGRNGSKKFLSLFPPFLLLAPHVGPFLSFSKVYSYVLTRVPFSFPSATLQTSNRRRLRRQRWWRCKWRHQRQYRSPLPLHAPARPEPRQGTDRRLARLPCRRDLVPAGASGQVLREGAQGVK